jgi:endonuclease/exonuclease/phosphatase family metal-dependent hydrolase
MQLNVWLDGVQVPNGIDKIVDIVHSSKANVVTFSEVRPEITRQRAATQRADFLPEVIRRLKKKGLTFNGHHVGGDVAVISQWEVSDAKLLYDHWVVARDTKSITGWARVNRGSVVVCRLKSPLSGMQVLVASAHLDWQGYSVYLPRGYQANTPFGKLAGPNTDLEDIDKTEQESFRIPALHAFVDYINGDDKLKRLPTILSGDFNTASHLDWTDATKSLQDHHGVVYGFPCSKFLDKEHFHDAWRELYPNPAKNPGSTWPSETVLKKSTSWAKSADERDRIDYIYYRPGPAHVMDLKKIALGGSRSFYARNEIVTDTTDPFMFEDKGWPSDHKAVVAEFQLSTRVL